MLGKKMVHAGETSLQGSFALGRQITIEYCDCAPDVFLDKKQVENALLNAAEKSGATIISSNFHDFNPQGISGVVIIAESHFTIHTWPEHNYAAVDIFTCGDTIDLDVAVLSMKLAFQSDNVVISSDRNRGVLGKTFVSEKTGLTVAEPNLLPISWAREFEEKKPWGVLTSVDIYAVEPSSIRDAGLIKEFVYKLCDHIKMKRFGECQVVHFGEDEKVAGFSMTQLIETSLISGHFANKTNAAYIDIFSCKFYEPREVAEFALSFFKGEHYKMQVSLRQ